MAPAIAIYRLDSQPHAFFLYMFKKQKSSWDAGADSPYLSLSQRCCGPYESARDTEGRAVTY